jgi:hypothetical protein
MSGSVDFRDFCIRPDRTASASSEPSAAMVVINESATGQNTRTVTEPTPRGNGRIRARGTVKSVGLCVSL